MTTCSHCHHRNSLNTVVCAGCGSLVPASGAALATACGDSGEMTPFPKFADETVGARTEPQVDRAVRKSAPIASERVVSEDDRVPNAAPRTTPGGHRAVQSSMATLVGNPAKANYDSGPHTAVTAKAPLSEAPAPPVQPRLVIVRGERVNVAYAILEGKNYVGRSADKPVDIDLDGQEALERIWTSRQHAVITFDRDQLFIEDLNSLNGTFVNRVRIHPGHAKALEPGDVLQFGTVQLKVLV